MAHKIHTYELFKHFDHNGNIGCFFGNSHRQSLSLFGGFKHQYVWNLVAANG